jgi:broad specificity phosphatase PhoE
VRLILIRHGEPEWTEASRGTDASLTARGRRQAEAAGREVAHHLPAEGATAILASPALRAQQTAAAIAAALGADSVITEAALLGLEDAEVWEKTNASTIDSETMALLAEVQSRAWTAVMSLLDAEPDATFVAVSHDVTINSILCTALAIPLAGLRRLRIDHASISVIDFRPQRTRLNLLNETCHLEGL